MLSVRHCAWRDSRSRRARTTIICTSPDCPPAAAASIAGFAIMFYTLRRSDNPLVFADRIDVVLQTVLPFFAALVALLMVSRIPYPHLINQVFSGQRGLGIS